MEQAGPAHAEQHLQGFKLQLLYSHLTEMILVPLHKGQGNLP